jgi:transcriptional regulator with XRE-family HTH domain
MLKEREKAIGARLRRFREMLQIPRTKFCLTVGLTADQLSAYEFGRANVRYEVFSAISKHYSLNPVWLATGQENPRLDGFSDEKFSDQIQPRELFSSVFDRLLSHQLTMDRLNAEGRETILQSLSDYSDPQNLKRLREARKKAGVTLAMLAATLSAQFRENISEEELRQMESGKRTPNLRMMVGWRYECRISEKWLKGGGGEMFTIPNWQTADYLARIKESREGVGFTVEQVAQSLAKVSCARVSGKEMGQMEEGKIILTSSVEMGLPHVLGVPRETLFFMSNIHSLDKKIIVKQYLEETGEAIEALAANFADFKRRICEL